MYTVVTTNLHKLRWHLFCSASDDPKIKRALDFTAQFQDKLKLIIARELFEEIRDIV